MTIKQKTKSMCFISFVTMLVFSSTAIADFNKAYDAYVNSDGKAMLQQVNKAVTHNKRDGLMLLLSALLIDQSTSSRKNLFKPYPEKKKTRLETILLPRQLEELLVLLIQSSLNDQEKSDVYRLLYGYDFVKHVKTKKKIPKKIESFVNNWIKIRSAEYSNHFDYRAGVIGKAKAGDPYAEMVLGASYLERKDFRKYGCEDGVEKLQCLPLDKQAGEYWLKKALYTYESSSHADLNPFYNTMCDLLQSENDVKQLKQAFLWCLMGLQSTEQHNSVQLLDKMYDSGKLELAAPEIASQYSKDWKKKKQIINQLKSKKLQPLPNWILETRKALKNEGLPVFTFYVNDYVQYEIAVYSDGLVKLNQGRVANVSRKTVKHFLKDLEAIGFYSWRRQMRDQTWCDNAHSYHCIIKRYQATVRKGDKIDRLQYFSYPNAIETKYRQTYHKQLAQLYLLVEQYFPTQDFRCRLGLSEAYQNACIKRDDFLGELATIDLAKLKK